MPELRKDPVTGRWVIISTARAKRPNDFRAETVRPRASSPNCPFCLGNEDRTPPEILAYRSNGSGPNTDGWSVRVVPNKFPALGIEGELDRQGEGVFDKMNGIGAHEVIIETPEHDKTMSELSEKRIEDVLWAFRDRLLDLRKDTRFRYVLIFKNHGESAGASLEHTHSQLIALPIVPKRIREEVDGARQYYQFKERCIYCDILRQELDSKVRIIAENPDFVTLSPYAPRFPFETWILPKRHECFFENSPTHVYENMARALKSVLLKMDQVLEYPAFNLVLQSAPLQENTHDFFHWRLEYMPRLVKVAGFEWGSEFYINPVLPEDAAKHLREAETAVPA